MVKFELYVMTFQFLCEIKKISVLLRIRLQKALEGQKYYFLVVGKKRIKIFMAKNVSGLVAMRIKNYIYQMFCLYAIRTIFSNTIILILFFYIGILDLQIEKYLT